MIETPTTTARTAAVTFPNKDGQRLFGILHRPTCGVQSDAAIVLLSPGVKMRVAPHRLYKKMAERFAALGFTVLRFDFHGLGDSEGDAPETLLADLYGSTQLGRYVADTICAMDWLQEHHGFSRFVAAGLCGGALTGLLAAERDSRITSLLALSIPAILDGSNTDSTKYMTDVQLRGTRSRYLSKFRVWNMDVWRSWVRFLTFQSHYSLIARSVMRPLLPAVRKSAVKSEDAEGTTRPAKDNSNPYFAPALLCMLSSSRRTLLIFAETDRLLWEFEAKFERLHGHSLGRHGGLYEKHVTKQANHIFSLTEWQQEMLATACRWLQRSAGEPAPPAQQIARAS